MKFVSSNRFEVQVQRNPFFQTSPQFVLPARLLGKRASADLLPQVALKMSEHASLLLAKVPVEKQAVGQLTAPAMVYSGLPGEQKQ